MDSLVHNKITMIKGRAGSGKTHLSLGYLFNQLEKDRIDKIQLPQKIQQNLDFIQAPEMRNF